MQSISAGDSKHMENWGMEGMKGMEERTRWGKRRKGRKEGRERKKEGKGRKEGRNGGREGGREGKEERRKQGGRGLSDILAIHFIIHMKSPDMFARATFQGPACHIHCQHSQLLSQKHISQGNASRRDGRYTSSSKLVLSLYEKRAYFPHLYQTIIISIKLGIVGDSERRIKVHFW